MPALSATTAGTDPQEQVDQAGRALAKAVTTAMRAAAAGLKGSVRGQIQAAGMGPRLGNAVRDKAFPEPPRYSPKATAEVRAYKSAARILTAFSEGVTITPGSGRKALAIPTDKAPLGRFGKPISATEAKKRFGDRLRLIQFSGGTRATAALALFDGRIKNQRRASGARRPVVMYWLVPSVVLAKRLDPQAAAAEWTVKLPGLVAQGMVGEG